MMAVIPLEMLARPRAVTMAAVSSGKILSVL